MTINATWGQGFLFNSTVYFRKGSVRLPSDVYHMLIRYIIDQNNYQIGQSGLYINNYQPDPFKACWKVKFNIILILEEKGCKWVMSFIDLFNSINTNNIRN